MDCLFCRIIKKEIPSKVVYEDDRILAFEDINPQAPVHMLVIPKKHIPTTLALQQEDHELIGYMHQIASDIAAEKRVADRGFRLVLNCNREAGQSVFHVHLHLLGGRVMDWPPG